MQAVDTPVSAFQKTHGRDVASLFMPYVSEQLSQLNITESVLAKLLFPPSGDPTRDEVNLQTEYPDLEPLPRVPVGSTAHTSEAWSYVTGPKLRVHQLLRIAGDEPRAVVLYSKVNPQDAIWNQLMAEWHVALVAISAPAVLADAVFYTRIAHPSVEWWKAVQTALSVENGALSAQILYLHGPPRNDPTPAAYAAQSLQEFTARFRVDAKCITAESVELTRDEYEPPPH